MESVYEYRDTIFHCQYNVTVTKIQTTLAKERVFLILQISTRFRNKSIEENFAVRFLVVHHQFISVKIYSNYSVSFDRVCNAVSLIFKAIF